MQATICLANGRGPVGPVRWLDKRWLSVLCPMCGGTGENVAGD